MIRRSATLALAGATLVLMAACGGPAEGSGSSANVTASGSSSGSSVAHPSAAESATPAQPVAGNAPSDAAKMICGDETKTNLTSSLALPGPPESADSWADKLYTCTYTLPAGKLVLSVKESDDPTSARAYFDALQLKLGSTESIDGLANLGLPAYKTADGNVVFTKDNMTLQVDASALTETVGPHSVSRTELSFEIATAILGCWREH
ncbi:hypothetical protein IV500_10620 [Paeniglutamicibacter antarcticus]|uniref:DUF3558 domain-containing protein n=1 Tax=Arthrobacter terrae TaxID=2935737 RepID=A0A931CU17_9MICC|nr:hypothetical protein [Arthrobacter terrae]MBG0739838.1 hypothetical protein [Arthrobacter terrae]